MTDQPRQVGGFLHRCRCDRATHDDGCPKWCHLRPGGATKPVPYSAKATTVIPEDN